VLLYELLTGRTPFDARALIARGIDTLRQTIRETEPVRPRTRLAMREGEELTATAKRRSAEAPKLISLLKGDLDWIVMKCLEKDRTRRYDTASGLAADLERHLSHEPILSRPPSTAYRLQKTVRRHRLGFAAAGALVLALLLGAVIASWQTIRATQTAEVLRLNVYAADTRAADVAVRQENLGQARQLLRAHLPNLYATAMVVGVLDTNGASYFSYGTLDPDRGGAVNEDSLFYVGGLCKTFTTTILADMAERGELSLADLIQDYLPAGRIAPVYGTQQSGINFTHLASHTSGLPCMPNNLPIADPVNYAAPGYTVDQIGGQHSFEIGLERGHLTFVWSGDQAPSTLYAAPSSKINTFRLPPPYGASTVVFNFDAQGQVKSSTWNGSWGTAGAFHR
jgi:hypothetical protein